MLLDEALARIAGHGPDLANGMTSHAPMAIEALCALGRPEAVMPWLDRYLAGMLPPPPRREPIRADAWRTALAREDRFSDWSAFFHDALARAPFGDVLEHWVGRLAPGISAAATHGVIRVGHATRSLRVTTTPERLHELADALASWASTYQELPTPKADDASGARERFAPRDAIARVVVVPPGQRVFTGTIVSSLAGLDAWPAFTPVIDLLDLRGAAADLAGALTETFARVHLANARDVLGTIVFVHGVTLVGAVANLLPHLRDETARSALRYAWQAGCGLYAAFGVSPEPEAEPGEAGETWPGLIDQAVEHGDEHAIKLTEACFAADARRPSPVHAAAVRRTLEILPRAPR